MSDREIQLWARDAVNFWLARIQEAAAREFVRMALELRR